MTSSPITSSAFWWSVGIFVLASVLALVILPGRTLPHIPTFRAALARHAIGNCHHFEPAGDPSIEVGATTEAKGTVSTSSMRSDELAWPTRAVRGRTRSTSGVRTLPQIVAEDRRSLLSANAGYVRQRTLWFFWRLHSLSSGT
jgi:hypothetical protein